MSLLNEIEKMVSTNLAHARLGNVECDYYSSAKEVGWMMKRDDEFVTVVVTQIPSDRIAPTGNEPPAPQWRIKQEWER